MMQFRSPWLAVLLCAPFACGARHMLVGINPPDSGPPAHADAAAMETEPPEIGSGGFKAFDAGFADGPAGTGGAGGGLASGGARGGFFQ